MYLHYFYCKGSVYMKKSDISKYQLNELVAIHLKQGGKGTVKVFVHKFLMMHGLVVTSEDMQEALIFSISHDNSIGVKRTDLFDSASSYEGRRIDPSKGEVVPTLPTWATFERKINIKDNDWAVFYLHENGNCSELTFYYGSLFKNQPKNQLKTKLWEREGKIDTELYPRLREVRYSTWKKDYTNVTIRSDGTLPLTQ